MFTSKIFLSTLFILSSVRLSTSSVYVDNGVVMLGVHEAGQFNAPTGLSYSTDPKADIGICGLAYFRDDVWWDSTSYGSPAEGWGASATRTSDGSSFFGGANERSGIQALTSDPLTVSGTSAIGSDGSSVTTVAQVTSGPLRVTHVYEPSSNNNAYEVGVTLENTDGSETLTDVRYRRTMDWDIPPTKFSECVSIFWDVKPNALEAVTRNGFAGSDPRVVSGEVVNSPSLDFGPRDRGADFVFLFKEADGTTNLSLGPGEKLEFKAYYGAAANKNAVDDVLASLGGLELATYAYPNVGGSCSDTIDGSPNTFFFGFASIDNPIISDDSPSANPSSLPSASPTTSSNPSSIPSSLPSASPTTSSNPSSIPSSLPSDGPSSNPSSPPSAQPSSGPSSNPSSSTSPSSRPSSNPSSVPSSLPSTSPSSRPSSTPSSSPSSLPSTSPSSRPSSTPSSSPSNLPSTSPSSSPSSNPSSSPSSRPSATPSLSPSGAPSEAPSRECEYRSVKSVKENKKGKSFSSKSIKSWKVNKKCEKWDKKKKSNKNSKKGKNNSAL